MTTRQSNGNNPKRKKQQNTMNVSAGEIDLGIEKIRDAIVDVSSIPAFRKNLREHRQIEKKIAGCSLHVLTENLVGTGKNKVGQHVFKLLKTGHVFILYEEQCGNLYETIPGLMDVDFKKEDKISKVKRNDHGEPVDRNGRIILEDLNGEAISRIARDEDISFMNSSGEETLKAKIGVRNIPGSDGGREYVLFDENDNEITHIKRRDKTETIKLTQEEGSDILVINQKGKLLRRITRDSEDELIYANAYGKRISRLEKNQAGGLVLTESKRYMVMDANGREISEVRRNGAIEAIELVKEKAHFVIKNENGEVLRRITRDIDGNIVYVDGEGKELSAVIKSPDGGLIVAENNRYVPVGRMLYLYLMSSRDMDKLYQVAAFASQAPVRAAVRDSIEPDVSQGGGPVDKEFFKKRFAKNARAREGQEFDLAGFLANLDSVYAWYGDEKTGPFYGIRLNDGITEYRMYVNRQNPGMGPAVEMAYNNDKVYLYREG